MKKLCAIILVLVMVLSLPVWAEEAKSESSSADVTANYSPRDTGTGAEITGVKVALGESAGTVFETGTVQISPKSKVVTFIVSGNSFDQLNHDNYLSMGGIRDVITEDNGWTIENNTATKKYSESVFAGWTESPVGISYHSKKADGTWENRDSGISLFYVLNPIDVTINWDSLSFIYDDTLAENGREKGWTTAADGGNSVTVTNNSEQMTVTVDFAYNSEPAYASIQGTLDINTQTLAPGRQVTSRLTLSNRPAAALSNAIIGHVTVTITEVK